MKRILSFLFILTLITCFVHTPAASAATSAPRVKTTITKEEDGGYYVEMITETSPLSPYGISPCSASAATVRQTRNIEYYNSSNSLCWRYSLTGIFHYITGISAACDDSWAKVTIYNPTYSLYDEKHSHSGSTATGTIKMRRQTLIKSKTISITCSKNGTFSY